MAIHWFLGYSDLFSGVTTSGVDEAPRKGCTSRELLHVLTKS
jgi:hypothetical protein